MRDDDLAGRLSDLWRQIAPPPRVPAFLLVFFIGGLAGWASHAQYWRAGDLDYALIRAVSVTARCKGISRQEQIRRIEARLDQPQELFTIDDKLVALDFAFDRLQFLNCLRGTKSDERPN